MTKNLPLIHGARTILVSPFSGGQDISPQDITGFGFKSAVHFNGQDFQVGIARFSLIYYYHSLFYSLGHGVTIVTSCIIVTSILLTKIHKTHIDLYHRFVTICFDK